VTGLLEVDGGSVELQGFEPIVFRGLRDLPVLDCEEDGTFALLEVRDAFFLHVDNEVAAPRNIRLAHDRTDIVRGDQEKDKADLPHDAPPR